MNFKSIPPTFEGGCKYYFFYLNLIVCGTSAAIDCWKVGGRYPSHTTVIYPIAECEWSGKSMCIPRIGTIRATVPLVF